MSSKEYRLKPYQWLNTATGEITDKLPTPSMVKMGTLARIRSRAAVTTEELTAELCEMNRQTCVDIAELRALIRRLRIYRDLLHAPENQEV